MIQLSLSEYHEYKFENCLANYRSQLLFCGIMYYSRSLVFSHLPKFRRKIFLGVKIMDIKLLFRKEKLISIQIYFNKKFLEIMKFNLENTIQDKLKKHKTEEDYNLSSKVLYSLNKLNFRIALCETKIDSFVYITLKKYQEF